MALVTIVLAALLLAGLARQSLLLAREAVAAQERLQRRWGTISIEHAVLERAEEVLAEEAESPGAGERRRRPNRKSGVIPLGGMSFQVLVADEDAKVNLNAVWREQGSEAVLRTVHELATGTLPVHLAPSQDRAPAVGIHSWEELFSTDRLARADVPPSLATTTHRLTCWGSGRLNVRRADAESIACICRLAQVSSRAKEQFLNLCRGDSELPIEEALDRAGLRENERERLARHVTDGSGCYSLWLTISDGERAWHELRVVSGGLATPRSLILFVW